MSSVKRRRSPERPQFVLYGKSGKVARRKASESEYR